MKANQEKLKCIKNKETGKCQRVPQSSADSIIKSNSDWHYTTKDAYARWYAAQVVKYTPTTPNTSGVKPKNYSKGIRKDTFEPQGIIVKEPNPEYDKKLQTLGTKGQQGKIGIKVVNLPIRVKEKRVHLDYAGRKTTLYDKVDVETTKSMNTVKLVPQFIVNFKKIFHLLVDGKRVKPLTK